MEVDAESLYELSENFNVILKCMRTFLNFCSDQAASSPGQWPGKSVEVMFVTVSALMPTVCNA